MAKSKVLISGSGPTLEGFLELPDLFPPFPAVLLCHPHPLYGGNMHNNVIVAVGNALVKEGFGPVLTFAGGKARVLLTKELVNRMMPVRVFPFFWKGKRLTATV